MNLFLSQSKQAAQVRRYALLIIIMWTGVVVVSAAWAVYTTESSAIEAARIEARAAFEKDLLYRRWASMHGGVYVPVTDDTSPNPYLDVPNRDVITTEGVELTLINPAYMTRQVHELAWEIHGTHGHITSLDPIRPGNAPDDWERAALLAFEDGTKEVSSVEIVNGMPTMRYMHAMITEESCLTCHAMQGYEVGDVRGGISVSVPMQPYWEARKPVERNILLGHAVLWAVGLSGIGFGLNRVMKSVQQEDAARQQLGESETLFRLLAENASDIVYRLRLKPEMHFEYVSPAATRILGYTPQEHYSDPDLGHQMLPNAARGELQRTLLETWDKPIIQQWQRKVGSPVWIEQHCSPIFDDRGELVAISGVARDVTERREIEDALRESELRYRMMANNVTDMISTHDLEGVYTFVSPSCQKLLGYEPEDLIGRLAYNFFHPNDLKAIRQSHDTIQDIPEARTVEYRIRRKDGTYTWFETTNRVVYDDGTEKPLMIIAVSRDIDQRKQMENDLRQINQRYDELVRNIPALVFRARMTPDLQLSFDYLSPRCKEFTGFTVAQMSENPQLLEQNFSEDDRLRHWELLLESRKTLNPCHFESPMMVDDQQRWVRVELHPKKLENGDVIWDGLHLDITERRLVQQHEFELALEREKRALLTTFFQNAAHEFRTPLTIISSAAYLMSRSDDIERRNRKADQIVSHVQHITRLVDSLLLLTKLESNGNLQTSVVDLRGVLRVVCSERKCSQGHKLRCEIPSQLPVIRGNVDFLYDAFEQLVDNACRYTATGGLITITAGTEANHVWIEVRDNGPGIPSEALPHIFETFWRQDTPHSTPGFGLGLPVAQKIIELHGGRISVESRGGEGSTFRVVLPCIM